MMKFMKVLFAVLFMVQLTACNSTAKNNETPVASNKAVSADLNFYYSLAAAFNEGNTGDYLALINENAIKQHVLQQTSEQSLVKMYGGQWAKLYAKALGELALTDSLTQWQYLYSEPAQGDCCDIAYYRYFVGEVCQYVAITFNKSRHILDLHFVTGAYSSVDFLNEFIVFYAMLNEQYGAQVQKDFSTFVKAANSADMERFEQAFSQLPEEIQLAPFVSDSILRRLNLYSAQEQARFNGMWKQKLAKKDLVLPVLLGEYVEAKQYELAIRAVKQLPEYALQDFYFQSELGALYAELGQTDKAMEHGRNAIVYAPDTFMSYWMFTALAISSQEYVLATQALSVIEAKFSVEITQELIEALDEEGKFLTSATYLNWQRQQASAS